MDETVVMGHGSGGSLMKEIIEEVFFAAFQNDFLAQENDACALPALKEGDRIAFSTDSFVVTPHFFPGGDIGHLAVCGTVNDVATSGATPNYISAAFILEEGFPIADLKRICQSMAHTAQVAGVHIVTGDTKVVNKGCCDGVFINTAGIGVIPANTKPLGGNNICEGDAIIVTGTLGDHGITIMSLREGLDFQTNLQSDAAPLNHLIAAMRKAAPNIHCFRDPTRGGLASTLNELAQQSACDMYIEEENVPVKRAVRGACDMLGYDPLQVANEGKMVCFVPESEAQAALDACKANEYGADAAIIGTVQKAEDKKNPKVFLKTPLGSTRILDMLVGEQLPRIC